ncbi:multicopper oxidase family protein [Methylocella sp.]|uniref:multicopper oxidase family protein n=1 Tax=Methylocella sp. TaxID=1978226 RepID=UPI0035B00CE2
MRKADVAMSPLLSRRAVVGAGLALALTDLTRARGGEANAQGATTLEAAPKALRLAPEPAKDASLFAYGASIPGPPLRKRIGETFSLRLVNALPEPTSFALLGASAPNAMDGVAPLTGPPLAAGASAELRFPARSAGLFAYRPLYAPLAAGQIGRGLFGAMIVDEERPPEVDGDLLAVVADWRLAEDGTLDPDFAARPDAGRIGGLVSLGESPAPLAVAGRPGARMRLRLVSACAARIFLAAFEGAAPTVLAIDGAPADSPFEPGRGAVPVGPGARFDLAFALPASGEARLLMRGEGEADRPLVVFKVEGEPAPARGPIAPLPADPLLPTRIKLEAAKRADFVVELAKAPGRGPDGTPLLWSVNGALNAPFAAGPLLSVKRGAPVVLNLVNRSPFAQQIHVRGHHFRLLHDLDDGWDPFWRDCLLLAPGRSKRVAFVAREEGRWAILSLIPDRFAAGLCAYFVVA